MSKDLKIAICFGLIMGAILSLCNLCYGAESQVVDMTYVADVGVSTNYRQIVNLPSYGLYYLELDRGYVYDITINYVNDMRIGFSNSVDIGSSVYNLTVFNENGTYHTFIDGNYVEFLFFDMSVQTGKTFDYTITRTKKEGMSNFIDNIAYSLSIGQLSDVWVLVVPILAISVLFGLGFYLLKRLSNKIKRAKGGV